MKTYYVLFLICILNGNNSTAQNIDWKPYGIKRIFIEPLALLDIFNSPSIRLGYEHPVFKNVSALLVGGIYNHGYYAKLGAKRYFLSNNLWGHFCGVSAFYKNCAFNTEDYLSVSTPGKGTTKGDNPIKYSIAKSVYGMDFEWGQTISGKHLMLEYFAGYGFRIKTTKISILHQTQERLYHYHESMIENITTSPGTDEFQPSFSLGVRIGYQLNTKQNISDRALLRQLFASKK